MPAPQMQQVDSSHIHSIGYEGSDLYIAFKGKDGKPVLYHYPGVDQKLFQAFAQADSKGKFHRQFILNKIPGKKIGAL